MSQPQHSGHSSPLVHWWRKCITPGMWINCAIGCVCFMLSHATFTSTSVRALNNAVNLGSAVDTATAATFSLLQSIWSMVLSWRGDFDEIMVSKQKYARVYVFCLFNLLQKNLSFSYCYCTHTHTIVAFYSSFLWTVSAPNFSGQWRRRRLYDKWVRRMKRPIDAFYWFYICKFIFKYLFQSPDRPVILRTWL